MRGPARGPAVNRGSTSRTASDRGRRTDPIARKVSGTVPALLFGGQEPKRSRQELSLQGRTVSSRLAKARKVLQQRLTRRGVVLSAAIVAIELGRGGAKAALPPTLVSRTIEAALLCGWQGAGDVISEPVAILAKGVLQSMSATKLKIAISLWLAVT